MQYDSGKVISFDEYKLKLQKIRKMEEKALLLEWNRRFNNINYSSEELEDRIKKIIMRSSVEGQTFYAIIENLFLYIDPYYMFCLENISNSYNKSIIKKKYEKTNIEHIELIVNTIKNIEENAYFEKPTFIKSIENKELQFVKGSDGLITFDKSDLNFFKYVVNPNEYKIDIDNEIIYASGKYGFGYILSKD